MKRLLLTLTGVSAMMTALLAQAPDLEVCVGKGYTLSSTAANPPFGATTYQWYENSSPVGTNSASYIVATGQAVASNYTYVRVASNAECPDGIASNTYTVRVRPAGADGQSADPCGCASGLTNCTNTNTCRTPTTTTENGDCTGSCHRRTVYYFNECGSAAGSGTIVDTQSCTHSGDPVRDLSCTNVYTSMPATSESICNSNAQSRAFMQNACKYNYNYVGTQCTCYVCN